MATIKLESQTTPPDTPPSGFIRLWSSGTTIKYLTSDGTERTLATGVTPEEVEDIVGNLVGDNSNIEWNYNDAGDVLSADLTDTGVIAGNYGFPTLTVDSKGRITSISAGPGIVRGDNFQLFKDVNLGATTSQTPQLLYSFNSNLKEAGQYRFGVHTRVKPNATGNDYRFEVRVDGTPLDLIDFAEEGKDTSTTQRHARGGFDYVTFAIDNTHLIEVYGSVESSGTFQLGGVIIEMWRV